MKLDTQTTTAAVEAPSEPTSARTLFEPLLHRVIARSMPPHRVEGIAVGRLDALSAEGMPQVSIDAWGLTGLTARALVPVDAQRLGAEVALGFENGEPSRPIILGFMIAPVPPSTTPVAHVDGERVALVAEREIELRCGEAAIVLTADGQIQLRGRYITSYATATQRILGGSVNLN